MTNAPTIRAMDRTDLRLVLDWARAEGWNPGLDDARAFFAADPNGFFMGWLDDKPVSAISLVKYGKDFAFLGLYIVAAGHRDKGYGKAVWDRGLETVAGRVIGLDGVVAQRDNYARSGFVLAHNNIRFGGQVPKDLPSASEVCSVDAGLFEKIASYETRLFPASRAAFLKSWLFGAPSRQALCLIRDGRLAGYGAIRTCTEGHKVGPLFAEDAAGADQLFRGLVNAVGARTVFLDVPEPHEGAIALAMRYGLIPTFETARMYRGAPPDLDLTRIFGITTFELG